MGQDRGRKALITMLAETHLHIGAGRSAGVVDLPVAREAVTGYPHLPETGLKGALRQMYIDRSAGTEATASAEPNSADAIERSIFGDETGAGTILISTGRLLLLPLRRLEGAYAWATCPLILERLYRDMRRIGMDPSDLRVNAGREATENLRTLERALSKLRAELEVGRIAVPKEAVSESGAMLEERSFEVSEAVVDDETVELLIRLIPGEETTRARLWTQLVVLSDDDFAWFCENGLPVAAHNRLAPQTKASIALWYEETLPTDTVLYALLQTRLGTDRDVRDWNELRRAVCAQTWLQVGGNETVGQGWVHVGWHPELRGEDTGAERRGGGRQ